MWNLREPQPSSPQGSARLRGRDDMLVDRVWQLYHVNSAIEDVIFFFFLFLTKVWLAW